jgi:hypothetical protein
LRRTCRKTLRRTFRRTWFGRTLLRRTWPFKCFLL